ncbi:shikimate dehydrogenase [Roseateles koreensis]|uniref:Shikimate dehydrogenase (NADP(+)) n=1 Tax=Roseateles koreensis TaxID=2987526 RepID=A0ABT5KMV4_9BURK|nr:shikimate dehydrogenase [Roseateles koreensis]MDC8784209.1 shikimate dehydrogenase [Roseateles koreensis]
MTQDIAPDSAQGVARYAVAGNPVAHSQSPWIHGAFALQTGQSLNYERLLCPLDDFRRTVQRFASEGGRGCNVTVPFKFEAYALAARLSERAELAQAVNTLRFDPAEAGGWYGDNTDGAGLVRDIQNNAGRQFAGARILLLGAGGASAGVLGSLIAQGPAAITLANRSADKAQALVEQHRNWAGQHGVPVQACGLADCGSGYDILINATSASLAGAGVPVASTVLAPGALALDMMYGPAAAPFLDWARTHGAEARDGLGMLVEQAAEAFELWRGVKPDTAEVLATLRAKLAAKS